MIPKEYNEFIQNLIKKTKKEKVKWEIGTIQSEVITTLSSKSIVLYKTKSASEEKKLPKDKEEIIFSIRSSEGKVIDKFSCIEGEGNDWNMINKLYGIAIRQAKNIKSTVEDLNDYLQSL